MPGSKSPGPSIKNPNVYEALRRQGKSKQDAARISNAQAKGKKGGKSAGRKSTKKSSSPKSNRRKRSGSTR